MRPLLHPMSAIPADVPDLARFAADVAARVDGGVWAPATGEGAAPVFVARAPGRLDVMGGIADYSGALVLQWPIREATRVALRRWPERRISIVSVGADGHERRCDVPLDLVADGDRPYDAVRSWFAADPARHWAAYVAGVFHVLAREHARALRTGRGRPHRVRRARGERRQLVGRDRGRHDGGGARGVAAADRASRLRALRCQQVENLIVGAPCGVMDQMAAICGEAGGLHGASLSARRVPGQHRAARSARRVGYRLRHPARGDRRGLRCGARRARSWAIASSRTSPGCVSRRAIVPGTCRSRIRGGTGIWRMSAARPSASSRPSSRNRSTATPSWRAIGGTPIR